MVRDGTVSGDMRGDRVYHDNVTFAQGTSGTGIQITYGSKIWYVDKGKSTGVTGDGMTWAKAFLTITEAIAKAGNDDVIFIGYGVYDEAATIAITQHGLRIFGPNPTGRTFGGAGLISTTSADDLMTINANRVEIAGLAFWCETNAKSGIVFGETYDPWHCFIHDCFFGYSGMDGNGGEYGLKINETNDCSDTVIERCTFHGLCTAGIALKATRSTIQDCVFQVYPATAGIAYSQVGGANPDGICLNNYFIGWGATGGTNACTGIEFGSAINPGRMLVARNIITNCDTNITASTVDVGASANQADESATTYLGVDAS